MGLGGLSGSSGRVRALPPTPRDTPTPIRAVRPRAGQRSRRAPALPGGGGRHGGRPRRCREGGVPGDRRAAWSRAMSRSPVALGPLPYAPADHEGAFGPEWGGQPRFGVPFFHRKGVIAAPGAHPPEPVDRRLARGTRRPTDLPSRRDDRPADPMILSVTLDLGAIDRCEGGAAPRVGKGVPRSAAPDVRRACVTGLGRQTSRQLLPVVGDEIAAWPRATSLGGPGTRTLSGSPAMRREAGDPPRPKRRRSRPALSPGLGSAG